jgi:hypothetical protein
MNPDPAPLLQPCEVGGSAGRGLLKPFQPDGQLSGEMAMDHELRKSAIKLLLVC